ncbi:MAG: phytoene/squalene synthase family protein [Verrucomicrobia bacterium]|nr:phytoene/squalene synthase family protein [Verrucomicrobiota bacterium]
MPDAAPDALLAVSHAYCHAQTRGHARSFYFASVALPAEKKRAAYAVYAFCRYADDLVDRAAATDNGIAAALARVGEEFDAMLAGGKTEPPFAPAFAWAVRRFGIEKGPFLDLLKGVAMDLGPAVRIADWPALREYCYHVASVVGLMMARIFELRDERGREQAIDLGIAMQLTNIIRDVGEDFRLGRIYLPADEMAAHGVAPADLASEKITPALRELLRFQVARAREFYRRAEPGIALLADDGSQLTVWLMRHVYAGILDEVERADYEVLRRRVRTSLPRKLALATRAWRDLRRGRRAGDVARD